jgi:hypothetical protein
MQDCEPGEFCRRGDDQVRHRRGAVPAPVCEQCQNLDRPVFDRRVRYSTGIDDRGGCASPARRAGPGRAE